MFADLCQSGDWAHRSVEVELTLLASRLTSTPVGVHVPSKVLDDEHWDLKSVSNDEWIEAGEVLTVVVVASLYGIALLFVERSNDVGSRLRVARTGDGEATKQASTDGRVQGRPLRVRDAEDGVGRCTLLERRREDWSDRCQRQQGQIEGEHGGRGKGSTTPVRAVKCRYGWLEISPEEILGAEWGQLARKPG